MIVVLTNYSIKAILHKPDASGRPLKWAIELSEFDFIYRPRYAIKGQVLVDFIIELSNMSKDSVIELLWILETDVSSKLIEGGVSMVL